MRTFSGPSVYTAKRFDVMVDRMVVFEDTSAADALAFLLGSFYLFNIEYPAGNALTLEFLQWYVMYDNCKYKIYC